MMGYGMGFGGGAAGLLWGLGGVLLLVGIVIVVVWAAAHVTSRSEATPSAQPDALELLRVRYARGEITEAEFVEARRVLGYQR